MLIGGYHDPLTLLNHEIRQLEEEGYLVPASLKKDTAMLNPEKDAFNETAIKAIYARLVDLPRDPGFQFCEPNDLEEIRRERPDGPRQLPVNLSEDELLDKFHGAWLGRSVGCALGKPVEGMGMRAGWTGIKRYLENRSDWPLTDYFSRTDCGDGLTVGCAPSCRENIAYMESDDDIRYTLLGLQIMETYGYSFTWCDVAETWNQMLPMRLVCTAERQALLNLNLRPQAATKEFTRRFNNPYREWIGAQIRADFWGWACAGNPELAAELAWRDASWTHTGNGIYGEMFFAALQAAAFAENNMERLIEIALSEIPRNCRLAAAIRDIVIQVQQNPDMESCFRYICDKYQAMSAVHTINNAVLCVAALLLGQNDPDRTICIAVMGGLDTDCNGATVGAAAGIISGHSNFGGTLADRLNDTIKGMFGQFQENTMTELARRTLAVYRRKEG